MKMNAAIVPRGSGAVFIAGVTGHIKMRPGDEATVKREVKALLRVLLLREADFSKLPEKPTLEPRECLRLGLERTPVVVMSSLAPGADTWVAEAALELEAEGLFPAVPPGEGKPGREKVPARVSVVAPLPFDEDIFERCSSFSTEEQRVRLRALLGDQRVHRFTVRTAEDDALTLRERRVAQWSAVNRSGVRPADITDEEHADAEKIPAEQGRTRRRRRYAAAGVYVATYSDLLLALWDGVESAAETLEGTAATVRMEREGFPSNVLPRRPPVSWADCSVVAWWQVMQSTQEGEVAQPRWRILLSLDDGQQEVTKSWRRITPAEARAAEERGEPVVKDSLNNLHDIAANLERLNKDWTDEEEAQRKARRIKKTEYWTDREAGEVFSMLGNDCGVTGRLREMAAARRRFVQMAEVPLKLSKWSLLWLLAAVGLAAILEHFYSHVFHHTWVLLAGGLLLVGAARWWFCNMEAQKAEARGLDYRALAEALRVQIYWAAAGMGHSVPANYLLRERSHLDYIRNVVTAWTLPYGGFADEFDGKSAKEKYERIRQVHDGWVRGQLKYFTKSARERKHLKHRLESIGWGLGKSGLWLAGGIMLWHMADAHAAESSLHHWLLLLLSFLLLSGAVTLALAEKWLLSEEAFQFGTMAQLFAATNLRFMQWLNFPDPSVSDPKKADEQALHAKEMLWKLAWRNENICLNHEEWETTHLKNMQELLITLGREALAENSEWLILHRARPLELPMAG